MRRFVFTLEHMRDYKVQVLDAEKNTLMKLYKRLLEIEENIRLCKLFNREKREEMFCKQQQGATMRELEECKFYLENTRRQLIALEEERLVAIDDVERQRKVVIKANQEVSSLDKLEERQLDDYHYLEARDKEKTMTEIVINQMIYSKAGPQKTSGIVS